MSLLKQNSSDPGLRRIAKIVHKVSGISLSAEKDFLIETRLRRRLDAFGFTNYRQYADLIEQDSRELQACVEHLTTHMTEWFREIVHYRWLKKELPHLVSPGKPFRFWSAACSSGQELYSMMFLLLREGLVHNQFRLLGTDISTPILEKAIALPSSIDFAEQKRLFLNHTTNRLRAEQELELSLSQSVKFREFNLIESNFVVPMVFDVIFLRNVLIYFDRQQVMAVCKRLGQLLVPGGHLVLGLSETLSAEVEEFISIGNSIYQVGGSKIKRKESRILRLAEPVPATSKGVHQVKAKKKILIIEDSKPIQKILARIFCAMPNMEIVGIESSAKAGAERFKATKPDLVSLDMKLEGDSGLDFLRLSNFKSYSKTSGARCVLVTDCSTSEGNLVFDAMSLGASLYVQKPQASDLELFSQQLVELLGGLFENPEGPADEPVSAQSKSLDLAKCKLIAIGSSTGGTEVVRDILAGLPKQFPPVVVVQHMLSQFTSLFAERLQMQTGRSTLEVQRPMVMQRNHVYVAAGDSHLKVELQNGELKAVKSAADPVNRFRPSVSVLFDSIEKAGLASQTVALILTGMGHDGAKEMAALKASGAMTIGQSRQSCVVYGMPRAAQELGALEWSGSPEEIVLALNQGILPSRS
jgi:two-component system chemotaxis response regulator CheB